MKATHYDLAIIGGGASGMVAAIAAKRTTPGLRVVLLEKKEKLGSKLYATGNGRCNLSNTHCEKVDQSLDFFRSIGIETTTLADGRIYPASQMAADVVTALVSQLEFLGVRIFCDWTVERIRYDKEGREQDPLFRIQKTRRKGDGKSKEEIISRRLIIATGGKAGPQYGCSGDGYAWAKELGHRLHRPYPTLTGVMVEGVEELKGVRAQGTVRLLRRGEPVAEETGEIQFNADGISGICVMNLTRFLTLDQGMEFSDYSLRISLRQEDMLETLEARSQLPGLSADDLLLSIVDPKLAHYILKRAGALEGSPPPLEEVAKLLQAMDFSIKQAFGWKKAQCTGGGIPYEEIDPNTMESIRTPALYLAGELLDYDGPCGGYNLDHAFWTGLMAGEAAARI